MSFQPDRQRAAAAIAEFLDALGVDVKADPELSRTAQLVADAYADDLLSGYAMSPTEILGETVATTSPGVVAVHDIQASIMCPHHLMPASGVVHVAYVPRERTVGLGALGRLVDCFARRLILQETLVDSIVSALVECLDARGAACAAVLTPTCLTARGQRRHDATATSFAAAGEMAAGQPLHDCALSLLRPIEAAGGASCG